MDRVGVSRCGFYGTLSSANGYDLWDLWDLCFHAPLVLFSPIGPIRWQRPAQPSNGAPGNALHAAS